MKTFLLFLFLTQVSFYLTFSLSTNNVQRNSLGFQIPTERSEEETQNSIQKFPSVCNPLTLNHLKNLHNKMCRTTKFETVEESKAACRAINNLCRPTLEPQSKLDCDNIFCPVIFSSDLECTDRVGEGYGTCPLPNGGSGFCHIGCGSCLECVFEFDCFGRYPNGTTGQLCQKSTNTCVGCTSDSQCQSSDNYRQLGLLYCVNTDSSNGGVCAQCRTSKDCLLGLLCLQDTDTCGLQSQ